jgi:polyisoprenoid-binding protein YceI
MQRIIPAATAALALSVLSVAPARAEPVTYKIDPTHTFTTFEAKHFGVSTLRGRFDKKEGTVTIDVANKTGKAEITIDLTSASTGVEHLNHHLQEADFFDTAQFPTATFVGDEFRFDGERVSQVSGKLTMHGKTAPVTLKASNFGCYQNPMLKREVCGGDFSTTLNRGDWGMTYGAPFPIAGEINLLVEVEAVRQ